MSQLTDLIHKIQIDLQGGITYANAAKVYADLKAEVPVVAADVANFQQYIVHNQAVEVGTLTTLISLAPEIGIPAAGVLLLEAALTALNADIAANAAGSDATQALLTGFAVLNKAWATRLQQVLVAIGIQ